MNKIMNQPYEFSVNVLLLKILYQLYMSRRKVQNAMQNRSLRIVMLMDGYVSIDFDDLPSEVANELVQYGTQCIGKSTYVYVFGGGRNRSDQASWC
ncbi:hypothetical protein [Halalkalibacter lacteus]|uniref:hypothetical protein n=1 Tax=Halalkalibacter lacteus TaxID=3090663 RepID=UPI002FCB8962